MLFIENLTHDFTTIESLVLLMYGGFILLLILFGWDLLAKYVKADKRTRSGDPAYMIFFIVGSDDDGTSRCEFFVHEAALVLKRPLSSGRRDSSV